MPIPLYTEREDEDFFAAIGRLTVSWAHLEFSLDCMVEILYRGFRGREIEPEMPRALKRKTTFLRKAFDRLPLPPEIKKIYKVLFESIDAAAQTRHDIIHGVVIEYIERSGKATMVRVIRQGNDVEKKTFAIRTDDILKAAVDAHRLSSKTYYWLNETYGVIEKLSSESSNHELS